jgi:hypothetical protein
LKTPAITQHFAEGVDPVVIVAVGTFPGGQEFRLKSFTFDDTSPRGAVDQLTASILAERCGDMLKAISGDESVANLAPRTND